VYTPHIGKLELYKLSGHYPYYKDSQYPPILFGEDDVTKNVGVLSGGEKARPRDLPVPGGGVRARTLPQAGHPEGGRPVEDGNACRRARRGAGNLVVLPGGIDAVRRKRNTAGDRNRCRGSGWRRFA